MRRRDWADTEAERLFGMMEDGRPHLQVIDAIAHALRKAKGEAAPVSLTRAGVAKMKLLRDSLARILGCDPIDPRDDQHKARLDATLAFVEQTYATQPGKFESADMSDLVREAARFMSTTLRIQMDAVR